MTDKLVGLIASAAGISAAELNATTLFVLLPLDSLEFMQLLQDVENEFHIKVENEEIASLNAIGDLERLVLSKAYQLSEPAKYGLPG